MGRHRIGRDDIESGLGALLDFLSGIPFPTSITADSKFKVSNDGAVMRGRDASTKEIKTLRLVPGETSDADVLKHFGLY